MEQNVTKDQRIMWVFGIAAALAAIGALAPLAFTIGAHSRVGSVAIPFGIAAIALAVNAVIYHQGRVVAVALYFVAGLAIVYGILAMLAIPLRLAVVGTCPAAPAHCPAGFEPPLTSGENSGLGTATFCGILAIFIGFYGLVALYRRSRSAGTGIEPRAWPATPPISPAQAVEAPAPSVESMPATPAEPTPVAVPESAPPLPPEPGPPAEPEPAAIAEPAPVAPPAPKRARKPAARRPAPKPPAPVEEELKELPAPEELKELPPPA